MYKPKHAKKKDLEAYLTRYEKNKIKDKIKNPDNYFLIALSVIVGLWLIVMTVLYIIYGEV